MLKKNISILISIFAIYILFSKKYIYSFLVPAGTRSDDLFRDWNFIINALECQKTQSLCDIYQYGKIFLLLPFSEDYAFIYYEIIPPLLIIVFVITIFKIIKIEQIKDYFLVLIIIFNPSTMLLLERGNIDLLFFLFALVICYSRFYWLNFALVSFSFLVKYYPIAFFVNFFLENKSRTNIKSTFIFLLCVVFSFTFLFLYTDQFNFWTTGHAKSAFHYLFSIKSFAKIINYLFDTNYIILLVFSYLFFIFLSIKFFIFFKKKKFFNFFNLYDTEDKLFIIGINTLVLCYLIFSNYYYREIFLILGLPLLIKLRDRNKSNFTNYLFSFVIIKYLFLFLYNYFLLQETYYHVDGVRIFYGFFIILIAIKSIFDFILMSILASFLISYNMQIIKKINFRHFY